MPTTLNVFVHYIIILTSRFSGHILTSTIELRPRILPAIRKFSAVKRQMTLRSLLTNNLRKPSIVL